MTHPVALITGVAGFAGSHLAEELVKHGFQVTGTVTRQDKRDNISALGRKISVRFLDITDPAACRRVVKAVQPHYLFHLAAFSSVGQSFGREKETYEINVQGTQNLLAAATTCDRIKSFLLVSSSEVYGLNANRRGALKETTPVAPISPYGVSKASAELIGKFYAEQYDLPVVLVRPFNHSGPRQAETFVIPSFARQMALIEKGLQAPQLKVGDLSVRRDISDVRDIVAGYRLLALRGRAGEMYHLCSGRAVAISDILSILLSMTSLEIVVKTDTGRLRKAEIPRMQGSSLKAAREVGFRTTIPLRATLQDTLTFFRARLAGR